MKGGIEFGCDAGSEREEGPPRHTHHPVDDARGNAEALLQMKALGLKISWD